jgi:cell wall-associated NlpC family hydrolase
VKKLCFYTGLAALFFVFLGNGYAQTILFEYDVSQKYPIYITFEGDVSAAWETTAWFLDEKSWHYNKSEWSLDPKTDKFYYTGPDQDNDAHWIVDNGIDFYIGPDDPNNSYAYLNNANNDWEMFRMALSDTNTIYASGNIAFDRIGGAPVKGNPYVGQWRSQEDASLVVTFNNGRSCRLEITNSYKNTPIIGKSASSPPTSQVTAASARTPTPAVSPSIPGTAAGGNLVRTKLVDAIKAHMGARYVLGANGMQSFDCSGLIVTTYKEVTGKTLPRSSGLIYQQGKPIKADELKPGDIIVFATQFPGRVSHVGMYIGDNSFVHAWQGSDNKVVLHSRDRISYGKPMKNMEVGYRRFLDD